MEEGRRFARHDGWDSVGVTQVFRDDVCLRLDFCRVRLLADLAPETCGYVDPASEADGLAFLYPALPLPGLGGVDSAHIDQVFHRLVMLGWRVGAGFCGVWLGGCWLGGFGVSAGGGFADACVGVVPRHGRYSYTFCASSVLGIRCTEDKLWTAPDLSTGRKIFDAKFLAVVYRS